MSRGKAQDVFPRIGCGAAEGVWTGLLPVEGKLDHVRVRQRGARLEKAKKFRSEPIAS